MDINYFEIVLSMLTGVLAAMVRVIWTKADRAEKTAERNKTALTHITRHMDKTHELTERLSSLEASFSVEIKNLSVSIKRMESALLRLDQHSRRTH